MNKPLIIAISLLGISLAAIAQPPKPLSKDLPPMNAMTVQKPKSFQILTPQKFPNVDRPKMNQKKGGVAGGGGNFTVPLFWQIVRETVIPELNELKTKKTENPKLTVAQINKLLTYLNPQVVKVSISPDPLFLMKNGKKTPVDAINYPSLREIELYQLAWQSMISSGMDIAHLIFHEFMGLAEISDEAQISIALFPARKQPISFENHKLDCRASPKFITIKGQDWIIRDGQNEAVKAVLSKPKSLNPNPECIKQDKQTNECIQRAGDYKVKTARVNMPIDFDGIHPTEGDYSMEADISFVSDYYGRGWGAAADTFFIRRPQFNITWKLLLKQGGKSRVLSIITEEIVETDPYTSHTTASVGMPVPSFIELLENNGYPLTLEPYRGELSSSFRSSNIAGFLENTAKRAGIANSDEQDQFVVRNVLKGAPSTVIPFRIHASCTLLD